MPGHDTRDQRDDDKSRCGLSQMLNAGEEALLRGRGRNSGEKDIEASRSESVKTCHLPWAAPFLLRS